MIESFRIVEAVIDVCVLYEMVLRYSLYTVWFGRLRRLVLWSLT